MKRMNSFQTGPDPKPKGSMWKSMPLAFMTQDLGHDVMYGHVVRFFYYCFKIWKEIIYYLQVTSITEIKRC